MRVLFLLILTILFISCKKEQPDNPGPEELIGSWYSDSSEYYDIFQYVHFSNTPDTTKVDINWVSTLEFRPGNIVNDGHLAYTYHVIDDSVFMSPYLIPFEFKLHNRYLTTRQTHYPVFSGSDSIGYWVQSVYTVTHYSRVDNRP